MTMDSEHRDLIQADLDGELDGPARAELARYLLAHPDARLEREALARLAAALAAIPQEEPPAELRERILGALPPEERRGTSPAAGGVWPLRGFAGRPAALRFAAALVGAALVATLAYQLGSTHAPLPSSELVGTMGQPVREPGRPAELGPVLDSARIEVGEFWAVVGLHGQPTAPVVSATVRSGGELGLVARAAGQQVQLGGSSSREGGDQALALAKFQPLSKPGAAMVEVDVVDPASGIVLHRTTLRFDLQH